MVRCLTQHHLVQFIQRSSFIRFSRLLLQNSWQLIRENSKHWRETEHINPSKPTSCYNQVQVSAEFISSADQNASKSGENTRLCTTIRMALMQISPNLLGIRLLVRDCQLTDQHWRHGDAADVTQSVQTQAAHRWCCCITDACIAVPAPLHLSAPDFRKGTWRQLVRAGRNQNSAARCSTSSCTFGCLPTPGREGASHIRHYLD